METYDIEYRKELIHQIVDRMEKYLNSRFTTTNHEGPDIFIMAVLQEYMNRRNEYKLFGGRRPIGSNNG